MPRLFIAVPPAPQHRPAILAVQDRLRQHVSTTHAPVRWTPPEQWHVTLRFLGDCLEEKLSPLVLALQQSLRENPPIPVSYDGFGFFPKRGAAKTLWLGVGAGSAALARTAEKINGVLATLGWKKPEAAFAPHLTLGRLKSVAGSQALRALIQFETPASVGPPASAQIDLMESVLSTRGAIHSQRATLFPNPR